MSDKTQEAATRALRDEASESKSAGADCGCSAGTVFLARQPILNRDQQTVGYELLFRSGRDNRCTLEDGDQATRIAVNNSFSILGLGGVVGQTRAFINLTRKLLLDEFYSVLPAGRTVVELLEDVEPDDDVLAACAKMRDAGYQLALDDMIYRTDAQTRSLVSMADYVKIDFIATAPDKRRAFVQRFKRPGLTFLAEKIETRQQFNEATELGYELFQGFFFCEPQIVSGRDIPIAKRNCLRLMQEINKPQLDFQVLEQIIKAEASLSVKLLQFLNSAALGVRHKITSIRQAMAMMGERPLRRWASMVAMTCLGADKPSELVRLSLTRARFCELMSTELKLKDRELDLYLLGLLSTLDVMLDCAMSDVLPQLPLDEEIKTALLGGATPLGEVQTMLMAWEQGRFEIVGALCSELNVDPGRVSCIQGQAIKWADEMSRI